MKMSLQEQAKKVLEKAQERGVSSNFFFVTTFKRYQVQMRILADLEKAIDEHGMTVTKGIHINKELFIILQHDVFNMIISVHHVCVVWYSFH